MKANDLFPSKFLKAEDLEGDVTLTVDRCSLEEFKDRDTGKSQSKLVVYFKDQEKGLLVNKTNFKSIAEITGEEDTDNWAGKKITLTVIDVDAFGDVVAAIRVKKVTINRAKLIERYDGLLKEAKSLKIELDDADWIIDDKTPIDAIVEAGKQLRELIDTAKAI
jgi:hypothetical protein